MGAAETPIRRIQLTLYKPRLLLYPPVKPTLVIEGLGHPAQWGLGTWQLPSDQTVVVGVYLFNRLWRFGEAQFALEPHHLPSLRYEAPRLPFGRGRIRVLTAPSAQE